MYIRFISIIYLLHYAMIVSSQPQSAQPKTWIFTNTRNGKDITVTEQTKVKVIWGMDYQANGRLIAMTEDSIGIQGKRHYKQIAKKDVHRMLVPGKKRGNFWPKVLLILAGIGLGGFYSLIFSFAISSGHRNSYVYLIPAAIGLGLFITGIVLPRDSKYSLEDPFGAKYQVQRASGAVPQKSSQEKRNNMP